jgi:hypothetical protein
MKHKSHSPATLAIDIFKELRHRKKRSPNYKVLRRLCEICFYASIRTEESEHVAFHVVYLNPRRPDPDPPQIIRNDRWTFIPLATPLPFTVSNLTKLAKASDPRSSSLVVYHTNNKELFLFGLVDQGNSYSDYVSLEKRSGFARPGIFHITAVGIGHLIAGFEMVKISELRSSVIVREALDVLHRGPVRKLLNRGISKLEEAIKSHIKKIFRANKANLDYLPEISDVWISALCRILLRIQSFRHGGALLFIPNKSFDNLRIRYSLKYDRLPLALFKNATLSYSQNLAEDTIHGEFIQERSGDIPADLYLDQVIAEGDLNDNWDEIAGTIWFISLLSRVDGLVLLDFNLRVHGFGVEILVNEEPKHVYSARSTTANPNQLRRLDYHHFGTRHRSMFRYCSAVPGSLGFVVSQDGDVRAITRVGNRVIVWENMKLQLPDFVKQSRWNLNK